MSVSRLFPPSDSETAEQYQAMIAGKPYLAMDGYLTRLRNHVVDLLWDINQERNMEKRMAIIDTFCTIKREGGAGTYVAAPFMCEYGNITIGDDVFIGPNATMLDVAPIKIGRRTMIGANCQLYTPGHPLLPEERNGLLGPEWGTPITIGDDVWIGGGVIIVGGVTIGDGCTIGAGAVVTKDVPARSVAVGNPARVVKTLPLPGEDANGDKEGKEAKDKA